MKERCKKCGRESIDLQKKLCSVLDTSSNGCSSIIQEKRRYRRIESFKTLGNTHWVCRKNEVRQWQLWVIMALLSVCILNVFPVYKYCAGSRSTVTQVLFYGRGAEKLIKYSFHTFDARPPIVLDISIEFANLLVSVL